MEDMYFGRIDKMIGGSEHETRVMSTEYADHNAKAARGPVIQKGGSRLQHYKKTDAGLSKADGLEPILFRRHACEDPIGRHDS